MATELATLQFKADTSDLERAERILKRLGASGRRAANDVDYLGDEFKETAREADKANKQFSKTEKGLGGLKKAALGVAAGFSAIAGATKLIEVAREFDVINASLKTMTGSTEAAESAFAQIQEFAATTPFDLAQVAQAFVKLKALGLDPSEEALLSYGNTASAMGKSLDQMVEAVADAATGEFERLKEFGIKARQQGDRVSFTFRGVTTSVRKSSEEIQGYLLGLGQTDFAGAMAERSETLDGALSNLADSWDNLFLTIANAGVADLIEDTSRSTIRLLDATAQLVKLISGEELTAQEQLNKARAEATRLLDEQAKRQERYGGDLSVREKEQLSTKQALIKSLETQLAVEEELAQRQAPKVTPEDDPATGASEETRNIEKAKTEKFLAEVMTLRESASDRVTRLEEEQLKKLEDMQKSAQEVGLNLDAQFEAARTEIVKAAEEERAQIRKDAATAEADRRREELAQINAEQEAQYIAEQDARAVAFEAERQQILAQEQAKLEAAQSRAEGIAAIEDVFMKDASEKEKAAFALSAGLMDAEKRERAKEIVSKSYSAAMGAYESLASIPVIGPALGAAAAAAIMVQGAQMAAKSLAGRALGGQVQAGESYIVGERGPEILTMGNARGHITPNEAIRDKEPTLSLAGRALGGQVLAGQPYVVGERGPEILTMGNSRGSMGTNSAAGRNDPQAVNKTANVSFNIQANDTEGFNELLVQRRGLIINMINEALNDQGRAALA